MLYNNKTLKLFSIFLFLCFFISMPAFARAATTRDILIYGKVTDSRTQKPLSGVLITAIIIPGAARHNAVLTDQQGGYSLNIKFNCYFPWLKYFFCHVTCAKSDYFSQTQFLYIGTQTKVLLNFSLKPKVFHDIIPPQGVIKINSDAIYGNSLSVSLNLSAQDNSGGSGISQMQFSNDAANWSTAEAYFTSKAWILTTGDGVKNVYVKYKDIAGNWSAVFSDTIILDTATPRLNIISPIDNEVVRPK